MAEIKILGNILDSKTVSRYSQEDTNLVTSQKVKKEFNPDIDNIEFYLYDAGGRLLNLDYEYKNYSTAGQGGLKTDGNISILELQPIKDIQNLGYNTGDFKVQYNFFRNRISSVASDLFIKEISSDRTEIRATSINITSEGLSNLGLELINELNNSAFYVDYLLNFGDNKQFVVVNIAVENVDGQTNILFKLYKPLPPEITEKNSFWVVEEIVEPSVFDINLSTQVIPDALPNLRGPNFDINVDEHNKVGTAYKSYTSLVNDLSGSNLIHYQQYNNLAQDKGIAINVDYSDLNEFVHFGSAKKRLDVIYYKIKSVEDYNNYITVNSTYTGSIPTLINDVRKAQVERDNIIKNMDGYERFVYFESGSNSWPKSNSTIPYTNKSTGSAESLTWFGNKSDIAESYDLNNEDYLYKIIPEFIRENELNQPYLTFVDMVGHYFDNIWIYIKSITDLWESDNNLNDGISKDLVYLALKSLGVKLYNSESNEDIQSYATGHYLGSDTDYEDLPDAYLDNIPKKDLVAELYKRIYHNLPLLLKSKGTTSGLNQLITLFGIPDSIIGVKEYGGNLVSETTLGQSSDKVRVIENTIEGNVLSPNLSLEATYNSGSEKRIKDTHFIDVSLSPQNQIDTVVSSSIALTGSFNIENYIGDPGYEYSSSYDNLDNVRHDAIDNSFNVRYDYAGFIRLVKYFDNSLFKMLKDISPARAEVSTGLTFRPQNLERIKIKRYLPDFSQLEIKEGTINAPTISEDKDYSWYNSLLGDKSSFYTGELTGSTHNIHQYFQRNTRNKFLLNSGSVDNLDFEHSDYVANQNNVNKSVTSVNRQRLEKGNLYSSEYQDFNDSLTSFNTSRYDGSKTTSTKYNVYTNGDSSYGKTAAIDKYTYRIGLFTEVTSSRFFTKKSNVVLKYLVDKFGNLIELNEANNNWPSVQRSFILGENLTVSLFNSKKYSNQKSLNGVKEMYTSGFDYSPMWYTKSGSANDTSSFEYSSESAAELFLMSDQIASQTFTTGNSGPYYLLSDNTNSTIYYNNNNAYVLGTNVSYSKYNVYTNNGYKFKVDMGGSMTFNTPQKSGSITWRFIKNNSSVIGSVSAAFTSSYKATLSVPTLPYYATYLLAPHEGNNMTGLTASVLTAPIFDTQTGNLIAASGSTIYRGLFSRQVYGQDGNYQNFAYHHYNTGSYVIQHYNSFQGFVLDPNVYTPDWDNLEWINQGYNETYDFLRRYTVYHQEYLVNTIDLGNMISYTSPVSYLDPGDQIEFQLSASLPTGTTWSNVYSLLQNQVNAQNGTYLTVNGGLLSNNIVFTNPNLVKITGSLFTSIDYYYNPSSSNFMSPLFSQYGTIDNPFHPLVNDLILIKNQNDIQQTLTIGSVTYTTSSVEITTLNDFSVNNNQISEIIFLKRLKDETSIILNFKKADGKTSFGFILPNNTHPDILDSINEITKEVKTKLVELGESV